MARRSTTIAVAAAALALAGCGKKHDRDPGATPPATPVRPPGPVPVAPPVPRLLPTFVTMDEIRGHQPTVAGLRMTTEIALDASGKQGIGNGCLVATGAKVAMHQLADAYGVARWVVKNRTTSQGDARGEFVGDFELYDGTLHVRGVLAAAPACKPDEVGVTIYVTKVVPAPKVTPPAPGTPPAGAPPAEPGRAPTAPT